MEFELAPVTDAGRRFVEMAEKHAADFAPRAAAHDADGSFPYENIEEMKASGFTLAPLPEYHGGIGLESVHDLMVGVSRLARADGSTAIAINMHLAAAWIVSRNLAAAVRAGDLNGRDSLSLFLGLLGGGSIVLTNATEAGTTPGWPQAELTPDPGGDGWLLNGTKIFSTLSPVADVFLVAARVKRDDGSYGACLAVVFKGSPGQNVNDDWDALGMRASGSGSVSYTDCGVADSLVLQTGEWGQIDTMFLTVQTAGNLGLLGAFVGIAEAAADIAVQLASTRRKAPSGRLIGERHGTQHAVAEMRASLVTARSGVERIGRILDDELVFVEERPPLARMHELMAEFQATKLVVNRAAIDAVDKAMQISGGAGYMSANPLSRLYRDVRAGPFMQTYSPNEAYEYVGKVTLGLDPSIEV